MRKRLISILLISCMLLGISACKADTKENADELIWHMEGNTMSLPGELTAATAQAVSEDTLYLGGLGKTGGALYALYEDGNWSEIPLASDPDYIYAVCAMEDSIGLLVGNAPVQGEGKNGFSTTYADALQLIIIDANGDTVSHYAMPENSPAFQQMVYADDRFICRSTDTIVQYSTTGEELNRLDAEQAEVFFSLVKFQDSAAVSIANMDSGNSDVFSLSQDLQLYLLAEFPKKLVTGIGCDAQNNLLIYADYEVGTVDLETGTYTLSFTSGDVGVTGQDLQAIYPWNGQLLLCAAEQDRVYLARNVLSLVDDKIQLLFVCETVLPDAKVEAVVNTYNKESSDYYITLKYLDGETYTEDQLRMDILTGKAPDIYMLSCWGALTNVQDGRYFGDLLQYLDADPTLSKESFVPKVLELMMEDGKLHWLPTIFTIKTCTGRAMCFPEQGITMEELLDVLALYPEQTAFAGWMDAETLFGRMISVFHAQFVDRKNGVCHFDSPEFIELLQMCSKLPPETLTGLYDDGLLDIWYLDGPNNIVSSEYTYVGFPSENSNGSILENHGNLAISAQTEYPDAAWSFIRMFFEDEYQSSLENFSVMQSVIERQISEQAAEEQTHIEDDDFWTPYDRAPLTQRDIDNFWNVVNNITLKENRDSAINDILLEEASAYFNGVKTAEEVAEIIQNRVALYLKEQN